MKTMINDKPTALATWQSELSNLITDPNELVSLLNLESTLVKQMSATPQFPLRVTRSFVNRIKKGDLNDPLLLQILPSLKELQQSPGFSFDPLEEKKANPIPGLLHKYRDRVLLTLTSTCAINCRYCFRRHFPYEDNIRTDWQETIAYIEQHQEIKEVVFSGGEPLIVKDKQLSMIIEQLASISHLKRLRIHSRLPIVLPSRITQELIAALTTTHLKPVMIVHANHANEINDEVRTAIQQLQNAQIPVFNQAVLLKDINDSTTALVNLSEALFAAGIVPYYLHLLDKVQGAAHFDISEEMGKKLIEEMMTQLPGYLVPKLVKEQAGAASKLMIAIS